MLQLEIFNRTKTKIPPKIFTGLRTALERELLKQKIVRHGRQYFIEITLVGGQVIRRLNKRYRRQNKPTDVISLSYFKRTMKDNFAGEIFICVPYARTQARQLGVSFLYELKFLFVHGMLHVFGFDHKNRTGAIIMQATAKRILAS